MTTCTHLLFLLLIGHSNSVGHFHWMVSRVELRLQTHTLLKTNIVYYIYLTSPLTDDSCAVVLGVMSSSTVDWLHH